MPTPRRKLVALVGAHLRRANAERERNEQDDLPVVRRRQVRRGGKLVEVSAPPDRETR